MVCVLMYKSLKKIQNKNIWFVDLIDALFSLRLIDKRIKKILMLHHFMEHIGEMG
jgi:hypothetical protein